MPIVVLESPYSGAIQRNVAYAQRAMNDARLRGEIPILTHLLWTQHAQAVSHFVSDSDQELEVLGRDTSLQHAALLRRKADHVVFCVDYGWSSGMKLARTQCEEDGIPFVERQLGQCELDTAAASARMYRYAH